jgi:DNA-directed RNA polymerase subunit RPC12/RpoP
VKDRLYLCGKCHLTFLARDDREHIVRCPRCHEMCFFRQSKRF